MIKNNNHKCCDDTNCKRKYKTTSYGKLYIENFFSCSNIKNFIEKHKNTIKN